MCEMLGMETQGLVHAKQMCYGLSHTPSPSLMDSKQVLYKYAIPSFFFSSSLLLILLLLPFFSVTGFHCVAQASLKLTILLPQPIE